MLNDKTYLELDSSFFHLNWVQKGAILALAQAIFSHLSEGQNLAIADASLIIRKVENQAPAGVIFDQLVAAKWFEGGTAGLGVDFFSREVKDYLIIKLAQMVIVHFQEEEREKTEGRKEVTRRKSRSH